MNINQKAMSLSTPFLSGEQTLQKFYNEILADVRKQSSLSEETFSSFTHELLIQPAKWYESLAWLEYAIETDFNTQPIECFFQKIFNGYDCNASVLLTDEDYIFYWEKIHYLFDKFAIRSNDVLIEKGLQYYNPRRPFMDRNATLELLQKAAEQKSETAKIFLGYYLWMGLCGTADKEKGMEWINSVTDPECKQKAELYKGYILLQEREIEKAQVLFNELAGKVTDPILLQRINEQKAFYLESQGNNEEAGIYYRKALKKGCSGAVMARMGYLNYNLAIEGANRPEGLQLIEKAFCFGRYEVVRDLFYCYYDSGQEGHDNERALYWLHKGYDYYDAYSTYQLAYLHLFDDKYKDTEKGMFYLEKAIELDYPDAICCKAGIYYRGDLLEKDIDACVRLLHKAIKLDSGHAAYFMGAIHEEGTLNKGEADYEKAFEYYEKAASLGDIPSCELAGRYSRIGLGCEINTRKALEYYNKGLEGGSPYCMVELALMYEEGSGIEANPTQSIELLKQAGSINYPYAYYLLGRYYRYGIGTNENPDEAIRYLKMAADENVSRGQTELGLCYEEGYGVEANGKKAVEYMLKAAEQEYTYAQYKIGCYYLYGLEGIPTDYSEAFKWMSKAAEAGYPYAQLELGDYYLYDYENKEESQKAYEYYRKAAENDCVNEGLGMCFEYGIGTEENDGEAFKYYMKGAEDGYTRAKYNAGKCFYYGTGIKKNISEAFRLFNEAAANDFYPAIYYKGKMLLDGEGCPQDFKEGIALLKQAAENEYAEAQFLLGNCYLTGKGVTVNEDLAMELFEQAADNGHEQALKITGRRRR